MQFLLVEGGPALEEAALDLGATPWQAFRLVIVPALKPALLSGALMAFTLSLDELIVTCFTAGPAAHDPAAHRSGAVQGFASVHAVPLAALNDHVAAGAGWAVGRQLLDLRASAAIAAAAAARGPAPATVGTPRP